MFKRLYGAAYQPFHLLLLALLFFFLHHLFQLWKTNATLHYTAGAPDKVFIQCTVTPNFKF